MARPTFLTWVMRLFFAVCCICVSVQPTTLWAEDIQAIEDLDSASTSTNSLRILHEKGSNPLYTVYQEAGGVILFRALVGDRQVLGIIDSGAERSIIDINLAKELELRIDEGKRTVKTLSGESDFEIVRSVNFEFYQQFSAKIDMVGYDLGPLSQGVGKDISIIVGMDVLSRLSFILDASAKRVLFMSSGAISPISGSMTEIPLKDGIVEVLIDGKTARMKIDLGSASLGFLYANRWSKIFNGPLENLGQSMDGAGVRQDDLGIRDALITLGPWSELGNISRVSLSNATADGSVGYGLFKGKTAVFDYAQGKLFLSIPSS